MYTMADYNSTIGDKLKDLDVGLLILNAGFLPWNHLVNSSEKEVEGQMTINMLHVTYTAKAMIN
jgi:short-subunit dehydrogenase